VQQRLFSVTSEEAEAAEAQDAQHSRAAPGGEAIGGESTTETGGFRWENMGKPSENVRLDGQICGKTIEEICGDSPMFSDGFGQESPEIREKIWDIH